MEEQKTYFKTVYTTTTTTTTTTLLLKFRTLNNFSEPWSCLSQPERNYLDMENVPCNDNQSTYNV